MFPLAIVLVFLGAAATPLLLARRSVVVEEPAHGWVRVPPDDAPLRPRPTPRPWGPRGGALGDGCVPGDPMPRFRFHGIDVPAGRPIPADTVRRHSLRVYRVPICGESPARVIDHTAPAEPTPAPRPRASATPRRR